MKLLEYRLSGDDFRICSTDKDIIIAFAKHFKIAEDDLK